MEQALEFSGMVFTMTGAFLITNKKEKTRLIGLFAFIAANYTVFAFASMKGLLPLQIQMIFFFFAGIPAIKSYCKNWKTVKKYLWIFSSVYLLLLISFVHFNIRSNSIPIIEIIAASIAVIGSYLQKFKLSDMRIISFIMFFVADILYVGISIENSLLFFGIQSFFFWFTSIKGIKSELNGESFYNWATTFLTTNFKTKRI